MYCKKITYINFDGNEVTDDFYFNLTKAELAKINFKLDGGFEKFGEKFKINPNEEQIIEVFEELIHAAVCEKSADGKRIVKNKDIADSFLASDAYSQLFIELVYSGDDTKITEFLQKVIVGLPADAKEEMKKIKNKELPKLPTQG